MSWSIAAIAAVGVWTLSACSPVILQTSHDSQVRPGVLSTFTYAAAGRDTKTVIIGNPFSVPKSEIDNAVIDAMQGRNEGPSTHFTTAPSDTVRLEFPIVMMFDPPLAMNKADLCRNTAALQSRPSAQRIRLVAGFCAQDELLSWVSSSIPRVESPSDPAFQELIAETTWNLIPNRNDDDGSGAMDF